MGTFSPLGNHIRGILYFLLHWSFMLVHCCIFFGYVMYMDRCGNQPTVISLHLHNLVCLRHRLHDSVHTSESTVHSKSKVTATVYAAV